MVKNILIGFGVLISVVAVGILFLDDDVSVTSLPELDKPLFSGNVHIENKDIGIEYTHNQVSNKEANLPGLAVTSKEKKKKDIKAYTADGQYEVALIDPNKELSINTAERFVSIKGQIDGKVFNLRVPKKFVEMRSTDMQLRITNKKTGDVQTTNANFLGDILNVNARHFIDIDTNDIDNVSYKAKKSILPLPGVAQDDN